MKKQIVLDSPVEVPSEWIAIKQAPVRPTRVCRPVLRCRLDRPPDSETLRKALAPKAAFPTIERQRNHAPHILVVEDETPIRQIYSSVLVGCGFHVETAEDGEAAWNALQSSGLDGNGFDLLITGHKMPKLSGIELIQKLGSAHIDLPVILASGTLPANIDRLQVAAILPKPFPLMLLIQRVREVLHLAADE